MTRERTERIVGELFDSWYSFLVRYATRSSGSVEVAEDLVQEVFLRLWGELRKGKEVKSPKGWTLRVLRHELFKARYPERKVAAATTPIEDLARDEVLPAVEIEEEILRRLEVDGLTRWFRILSRREEEVLMLRLGSLKYREIGAQLGLRTSTVETLLSRALVKLRDVMGAPAGPRAEARTRNDALH